ncbi:MAG: LPS assembly protein LptD, partial [Gammaproteobacteria bacterium]
AIGLSKEQIEYLLGKPAKSPFNDNQWDYFYSNNIEEDEIKSLSVYFKNEKVFSITINNKIYTVFGQIEQSEIDLSLAPLTQVTDSEGESENNIIKITLEDVLNDGEELGLCKLNLYETFKDVKTLTLADESTLEIRADNQSQEGTIFTAEGNAEAERQNDMLKADKITYDTSSKKVSALGEVKYFSDEISIYSKSAEYEGNKSDIGFSQAKYFRASGIGSGVSDKITFKSNKDVFLKNATYTSCNIDDPDWQLTSTSTTLYNSTERGHSYNMILKYKNIPIFYTPFISYPLTDKRQSGILTPSFGSAGDSGTSLSVPYYFNLAENYDATVEVTSMSDRGVMFDNELRYLGFNESTLLNFTHLESDDEFGDDRYLYKINDKRILYDNMAIGNNTRGFMLRSDINYSRVSDLDYFDDFGNSLSTASQSNVKREIRLYGTSSSHEYTLDYDLSTLSYQPAQTGVNEQYQTVPSFKLNYKNKSTSTLNYNLKASIDKFEHKDNTKAEGVRYLIYPSIQMPIVTDGWELTSKLGIRHVDYDLDNNVSEGKSKTTPIASIRGKLYFDKYVGDKLYTLEPEAYLLYIPVGNQDNNPIFDTGLKEFKYSLFSENKFYGEDRINDAKQISLGLTHRVIDEVTGDELFSGTIGQIIYFDDRDVHLTNNTKSHSDASNIIGLASTKLSNYSTLSLGSVYNPHKGHGMRNNIRYRYDASSGSRNKIFNTDYRFIRGSEEEIDFSGVYSFNKEFSLVGKYNY